MTPDSIQDHFTNVFGDHRGTIIGRAPGRVNLIGEHTDYNDGFVFPMAIDFSIRMAARLSKNGRYRIGSVDFNEQVEGSLADLQFNDCHKWANYPVGVIWALREAGIQLPGVEMVFAGDIPQGAGLSSSAALEVATAIILQQLLGFDIAQPELALLCQKAENKFVGMNCGIMDQFISMMGQKGHALFLDCRSLAYENIPLTLGDYRIVICQSGVKHALVDSEYNQRRQECEQGVALLQERFPNISALRDATLEQLESCRGLLSTTVYRRCLHIISENQRVLESVDALRNGNLQRFGELMNASHDSLRDDYEVSCSEIDLLVRLAREVSGVLGSRITGGGFGGCTVSLVAMASLQDFTKHLVNNYKKQTGIEPQFYVSTPGNGAEIINR